MIIVAVAAFTPCCMLDNCQDDLVTKQDAQKKTTSEGVCSPFFACASCHGFTTTVHPITIPAPVVCHQQYFNADFNYISAAYTITPWQPPRIV
jgi:hypothetical protein